MRRDCCDVCDRERPRKEWGKEELTSILLGAMGR
jgi:hypothetical protein